MRIFVLILCFLSFTGYGIAQESESAENMQYAHFDHHDEESNLLEGLFGSDKSKEEEAAKQQAEMDKAYIQSIQEKDYTNQALLQGLNKITARTSPLLIDKGSAVVFGNLEITLHSCWRAPPEEEPESKALLSIFEEVPGEKKKHLFYGWMFASSPGISALEHPIYDVTLIECKTTDTVGPSRPPKE